ncbi:MAG: amino acid ABC transporter permease [Bacillota bacterium]
MSALLSYYQSILPKLWAGTLVTLQLSFWALLIGFAIGLPMALARIYGRGLLKALAIAYIELLRGSPLVVQLLLIYYGLPQLGIVIPGTTSAIIALGLNSAAYQAEYYRGAILAVSEGQMMAARALGMSRLQAIRHIVLPQALRLVLPALSNEVAYMLKYSSVAFLIAVKELTAMGKIAIGRSYKARETWLLVAVFYIILVNGAARLMQYVERKFKIPGLQMEEVH